jgi:hypothetical protein
MPNPKSPVVPGLEQHEVVYAKDQPQYIPLPTLRSRDGRVMSRWAFTPEERQQIANGADLYLTLHTFLGPLQPIQVEIISVDDSTEMRDHISERLQLPEEPAVQSLARPVDDKPKGSQGGQS